MGVWVVGAVPDTALARVRHDFPRLPAVGCLTRDFPTDLAWWREHSEAELFFDATPHGPSPTGSALRLHRFVESSRTESEAGEAMKDTLLGLFPQHDEEGLFHAVSRKADPATALAYALGPQAFLHLPGWFGDFLLSSRQVPDALAEAESTLSLPPQRCATVLHRIREWMTGMGDDPRHDADELLDGPMRVLRHAARTGSGAAGLTRWY